MTASEEFGYTSYSPLNCVSGCYRHQARYRYLLAAASCQREVSRLRLTVSVRLTQIRRLSKNCVVHLIHFLTPFLPHVTTSDSDIPLGTFARRPYLLH